MNNTNFNQQESAKKDTWKITAIVFIALSVILSGLSIFLAVSNNQQTNNSATSKNDSLTNTTNSTENATVSEDKNISTAENSINHNEYLVLPEIGIKIKTQHAVKLSQSYSGAINSSSQTYDGSTLVDYVRLEIAREFLTSGEGCLSELLSISRLKDIPQANDIHPISSQPTIIKVIGDYSLGIARVHDGGYCSESEMQLKSDIWNDISNPDNWSAL